MKSFIMKLNTVLTVLLIISTVACVARGDYPRATYFIILLGFIIFGDRFDQLNSNLEDIARHTDIKSVDIVMKENITYSMKQDDK